MEQARAHGRLGDAGDRGRLRRRQLLDLAQHEGDALGQRQPIQRGAEAQAQLAAIGLLLRVARWIALVAGQPRQRALASRGRAPVVARALDRDREQERLESSRRRESDAPRAAAR